MTVPSICSWCCLVDVHVFRYLDWQNDQHAINTKSCGRRTVDAGKLVYSKCTVIDKVKSSLTGYNEVTKTTRMIEQKWTTNKTKWIKQRIEYESSFETNTERTWIEYELRDHNIDNNNAIYLAVSDCRTVYNYGVSPKTEKYWKLCLRRRHNAGQNPDSFSKL